MIYIVSGTYQQAKEFCHYNMLRIGKVQPVRDVIIVTDATKLRGRKKKVNDTVMHVGTWYDCKDYQEVYEHLLAIGFTPKEIDAS